MEEVYLLNKKDRLHLLNKKNSLREHDWRNWKRGWQYNGDIEDDEYLRDRSLLFRFNGNGWWYYDSVVIRPKFLSKLQLSHIKNSVDRWKKQMKDLTR